MELSLLFEDNNTGHKDLVLRFAGEVYVCDSYYLALDCNVIPEREGADKIRVVLQTLLKQWLFAVENVPDGDTVYLPYDFSDQYTGWLRCFRTGNRATICRGWAEVEGWALSPSAIGPYLKELSGFRPTGPTIQVSLPELIEAIQKLLP